jgi:hypothetical protein
MESDSVLRPLLEGLQSRKFLLLVNAVWLIATGAPLAMASGESASSTVMANRVESRQAQIKRILCSDRTNDAKLDALQKFVRFGDSEYDLRIRLGDPIWIKHPAILETELYYESSLFVVIMKGRVVCIGYGKKLQLFYPRPN